MQNNDTISLYHISTYIVNNFIKLVQERFKLEANKPCLISVPQYFFIDNFDVLSMAKNSDIINNNNVVYYDRPSFDSNFAFDTHMYKHKNESKEEESIEKYKITIVSYNIFGLNYVYATDSNTRPDTDNVLLNIADNLSHWGEGAHINDNKYIDRAVLEFKNLKNTIYTYIKKKHKF